MSIATREIPLAEKLRIFSRVIDDIIERHNLKNASEIDLSQNQMLMLRILENSGPKMLKEIAGALEI